MAYFVNVGTFQENKSGVGSRGYQLFRRGKHVITRWGGIAVTSKREFHWCYKPKEKIYPCESVQAAKQKLSQLRLHRTENENYSRLPVGIKITG